MAQVQVKPTGRSAAERKEVKRSAHARAITNLKKRGLYPKGKELEDEIARLEKTDSSRGVIKDRLKKKKKPKRKLTSIGKKKQPKKKAESFGNLISGDK